MSFEPACRPATGLRQACTIEPLYSWRNLRAPRSLTLAPSKVGFSPPGTPVRMKCEHVCARVCMCTHVRAHVWNTGNQPRGYMESPQASVRLGEQHKCIWTGEENPKPMGNRVAQRTLPALARMQFSQRLSVPPLGRVGGSAEIQPKTPVPRTSPWLCLESHGFMPSGSPIGHGDQPTPCLSDCILSFIPLTLQAWV